MGFPAVAGRPARDELADARFRRQVLARPRGRGVDVVLNSLNGDFIPKSLAALADGGRFVEIGKIDIWTAEQMAAARPDVATSRSI
jgi:NADPH:quinone reductase-like Zn-dependent oxidoreductase